MLLVELGLEWVQHAHAKLSGAAWLASDPAGYVCTGRGSSCYGASSEHLDDVDVIDITYHKPLAAPKNCPISSVFAR